MAHIRNRHITELYKNILSFSPLVGIFGHRQVGKTTFLEQVAASYQSFDDEDVLKMAESRPKQFLNELGKKPAGIDECQLSPKLFPALKEFVRLNKRPGQIVLSGSVRFYSRVAIRESLTGRIVNIDLLPLCLTELYELDRAKLVVSLLSRNTLPDSLEASLTSTQLKQRENALEAYDQRGGLPGLCFMRNTQLQTARLREQLNLLLDRDLRLIYPTSLSYLQIQDFVRALAQREGDVFRSTTLRRETGLAEATQKKLLHALESIFLIRTLPIEGSRHGVSVYFEDQLEWRFLNDEQIDAQRAFEGLVFRNIRASFNYEIGLAYRFFQFRKSPDICVPFAVKVKETSIGFLPIITASPTRQQLRSAHQFLQTYNHAFVVIITKGHATTTIFDRRILVMPAERILFE